MRQWLRLLRNAIWRLLGIPKPRVGTNTYAERLARCLSDEKRKQKGSCNGATHDPR